MIPFDPTTNDRRGVDFPARRAARLPGHIESRPGSLLQPGKRGLGEAAPGRRPVDERIQNPTVLIQRDLAHVWSPYTIDIDGKRLHCGIDSFGLAKVDGAWKLTSLTWTAEPNGCPQ